MIKRKDHLLLTGFRYFDISAFRHLDILKFLIPRGLNEFLAELVAVGTATGDGVAEVEEGEVQLEEEEGEMEGSIAEGACGEIEVVDFDNDIDEDEPAERCRLYASRHTTEHRQRRGLRTGCLCAAERWQVACRAYRHGGAPPRHHPRLPLLPAAEPCAWRPHHQHGAG